MSPTVIVKLFCEKTANPSSYPCLIRPLVIELLSKEYFLPICIKLSQGNITFS